ncbi:MAG: ABC transporter substrate-binding protein [Cyanobacteria bacterium J06648_16]
MAKRNELPALLLSLLVTLGLLAGGAWLLRDRLSLGDLAGNPASPDPAGQATRTAGLANRLSLGERVLTPGVAIEAKQSGTEALTAGRYAEAIASFEAALAQRRNDPETRIYLNNARIGEETAYMVAIAAPLATLPNPALELLRGVAQAQQAINDGGGIGGVPLRVLIVSDDNDPAVADAVANALVANPDVLAVVGHYSSSTTLGATETYEAGQLVMISPVSTAVSISQAGDYIFRTVPSDRLAAATLARHFQAEVGNQRAVVFYSSASTYSQSLRSEFTTALLSDGGGVVAEFDLAQPNFDPNQALQQARQQGAEALILVNDVDTLDLALQVISVNRGQIPVLGGDDLYNPKVLQIGGENARGMVVSVPWHVLSHEGSDFVETSRQLWGGDVSWRTAMAYDAIQAMAAAIAQSPTRTGIQQALSQSDFEVAGADRPVKFFANGDRNQATQLVYVVPGERSGFGYDYIPIDASLP